MYSLEPEITYKAKEQDQAAALDEAVAFGVSNGWQLVSVIWQEQDSEGKHIFRISFNKPVAKEATPKPSDE